MTYPSPPDEQGVSHLYPGEGHVEGERFRYDAITEDARRRAFAESLVRRHKAAEARAALLAGSRTARARLQRRFQPLVGPHAPDERLGPSTASALDIVTDVTSDTF